MKTATVTIEGISALLINRFKEQSEIPKAVSTRGKKDYGTPREQAEATAYADEKTKLLFVPSSWISGALATVASDYKITGSKKSMKSVIGGAAIPTTEKIFFDEKYKIKDIEIDSRPAVVNRARIMRHRSRLENWTLSFELEFYDDILPADELKKLFDDAGRRAGMGDYRPPKGGPFEQIPGDELEGHRSGRTRSRRC